MKKDGWLDLLIRYDAIPNGDDPINIMKRGANKYLTVSSYRLRFVDHLNFAGGKVSLR